MKIAAILVTFNRKALLSEALHALRRELSAGSPIFVVDNASTDGTGDWLIAQQTRDPNLKIHLNPENTGGAGGFSKGMELALIQSDADWFFLIDDDVEVLPGAFQNLELHLPKANCFQFTKVYADGAREPLAGWFDIAAGRIRWIDENQCHLPETIPVNYGCFEGMLIHRSVVEKIGLPDPRFFIWQDDIAYGLKASFETPILYLTQPRVLRKIRAQKHPSKGISLYYLIRNQFLIEEILRDKPGYSFYRFRLQILLRLIFKATHSSKTLGYEAFTWAWRGLWDGLHGRFGKLEIRS